MDAIVKWKIWSVRIILTINTKKGKGNNILILECPLMILTELAIITGLFYGSFLNAVIFLVRKSMAQSSLNYGLSHGSRFTAQTSGIPSVTMDHFFLDASKIVRPISFFHEYTFYRTKSFTDTQSWSRSGIHLGPASKNLNILTSWIELCFISF